MYLMIENIYMYGWFVVVFIVLNFEVFIKN